jgi:hypothetical protein
MTDEILGGKPEKYVSELTARQLAMAAYQKALYIRSKDAVSYPDDTEDYPVFGVACTVSLQKTPEERAGRKHFIYAALQTGTKTVSLSVEIDPQTVFSGQSDALTIRVFEETFTACILMNLIAEGCGLSEHLSLSTVLPSIKEFGPRIPINRRESAVHPLLEGLLDGSLNALLYQKHSGFWIPVEGANEKCCVLPGSFRPAHPGHFEMAQHIEETYTHYRPASENGGKCDFELSIRNAAKPPLDFISLEERLATIGDRRVWITNAPTFKDKAKIFPNATFVVGYDTAARIIDPKYADINEVIQAFQNNNTMFAVFGRSVNGNYNHGLEDFPQWFRIISIEVTYVLRNCAVSSTELRATERAAGSSSGNSPAGLEAGTNADQGNKKGNPK